MKTIIKWTALAALAGFVLGALLGLADGPPAKAEGVPAWARWAILMGIPGLIFGAPAAGAGFVTSTVVVIWRRVTGRGQQVHGPLSYAPPHTQVQTHGGHAGPAPDPQGNPAQGVPVPLAPMTSAPERTPTPAADVQDPERLNKVLAELDALPGLESVAQQVRQMATRIAYDQAVRADGVDLDEGAGYHAVLAGPPGTGKTEVARIYGRALAAMGALPSGHVVEVKRQHLVAEHVGGTAPKTEEKLSEARGGVFFLDEAYSLAPPGPTSNDTGREAVETILTRMEDDRGEMAVLVAGYEDQMNRFLEANPGLASRFSHTILFAAYDGATLMQIAESMAAAKFKHALDPAAREMLARGLTRLSAAPPKGWGNARDVRRIVNACIDARAARGGDLRDRTLTAADVEAGLAKTFPQAL